MNPNTPPASPKKIALPRNIRITNPRLAPKAIKVPISLRRSVTLEYITLAMLAAPTNNRMERKIHESFAIKPFTATCVSTICAIVTTRVSGNTRDKSAINPPAASSQQAMISITLTTGPLPDNSWIECRCANSLLSSTDPVSGKTAITVNSSSNSSTVSPGSKFNRNAASLPRITSRSPRF